MTLPARNRRNLIALLAGAAGLVALAAGVFVMARQGGGLSEAYAFRFGSLLAVREQTRNADYQNEIAFYQERIRRNPEGGLDQAALAGAYLKKARVGGQPGWYLLAERSAERSLDALPAYNTGAKLVLAEIASARHDFAGALRLTGEILAAERTHAAARSLRATVKLAQGDLAGAAALAEGLAGETPTSGHLTQRALIYLAQGKDAAALADFRAALAVEEPGDFYGAAWRRTLLGRYHLRRGEVGLAGRLLDEALRVAPGYPPALLHLAELETRQGRYRAAEGLYRRVLEGSGGSASLYDHAAYAGLARAQRLAGNFEAEATWAKAIERLRQEVGAGAFGHARELARVLLERGRPGDTPEALRLAHSEAKLRRDGETLEVLAWAEQASGRLDRAWAAVEEALATGRNEASLHHRAAEIAQKLGDGERAEQHRQEAKAMDPGFDPRRAGWGDGGVR